MNTDFTIEEVKGWSSHTCFPTNKYKGQLVLLADLVGEREKGQRLLGFSWSILQVDGDCYETQWLSFLHLDNIWLVCCVTKRLNVE